MKEQSLEALTQRLERVERENRRLKFLGVAASLVVGVVLLSTWTEFD